MYNILSTTPYHRHWRYGVVDLGNIEYLKKYEINQYYKRFIPRELNIFRFQNFTPQYNSFYSLNKFLKHFLRKLILFFGLFFNI